MLCPGQLQLGTLCVGGQRDSEKLWAKYIRTYATALWATWSSCKQLVKVITVGEEGTGRRGRQGSQSRGRLVSQTSELADTNYRQLKRN